MLACRTCCSVALYCSTVTTTMRFDPRPSSARCRACRASLRASTSCYQQGPRCCYGIGYGCTPFSSCASSCHPAQRPNNITKPVVKDLLQGDDARGAGHRSGFVEGRERVEDAGGPGGAANVGRLLVSTLAPRSAEGHSLSAYRAPSAGQGAAQHFSRRCHPLLSTTSTGCTLGNIVDISSRFL